MYDNIIMNIIKYRCLKLVLIYLFIQFLIFIQFEPYLMALKLGTGELRYLCKFM